MEGTTVGMEPIGILTAAKKKRKTAILPRMTGIAAPQAVLVVLEKEIATGTVTALETWCVERTTVGVESWTAVCGPKDP